MAKKEEGVMTAPTELNSIVGKGSSLEGNLDVQNSLRIDGRVKGNVKSSDTLIVGKEGEVEGEIVAKNVVIGGRVNGKIEAVGRVVLEATAVFTGELKTSKLVIDEGAVFNGQCSMKAAQAVPGAAATPKKGE
ncbi:MAG: polymer-forming cytoskeletal protein [candidate division KSB1 bacterium]|nr:polymer-forming cytoskeletal protein [candidate division KSB1 bacterium]